MRECKHCQKEISNRKVYCDNKCQQSYQNNILITEWLDGKNYTRKGGTSIPQWMRKYLLEDNDNKCSSCGWGETNEYTGTIPLDIDHIDGDAYNNIYSNLRVLCPNCHSLTKTYKNAGRRKSTRTYRI